MPRITVKAIIDDLMSAREKYLMEGYDPAADKGPASIGYPRTMYFYEQFPFWNAFWKTLGYNLQLSPKTNRVIINEGLDAVVAEPCFPIKVAHGHVRALLKAKVDYVFLPNVIDGETEFPEGQLFPVSLGTDPSLRDQSQLDHGGERRLHC